MPRTFGVSNPKCKGCELHEYAQSVCVPGRAWVPLRLEEKRRQEVALLVVGEAPGREEDERGECFVGEAGGYLDNVYLDEYRFAEVCDVYVTNALKCRPIGNAKPNKKHMIPCSVYWQEELRSLADRYPRVVILCAGTIASQALIKMKATTAFRHQGIRAALLPDNSRTFEVYTTYHPAFLMPGRNPNGVVAVEEHLTLLRKAIVNPSPTVEDIPYTVAPDPQPYLDNLLALDTETYGLFRDAPPQTQFNPIRSMVVDNCPADRLVRLISLAWRGKDGIVRAGLFLRHRPDHMAVLHRWLGLLAKRHGTLLCMNTLFDVTYLRATDPLMKRGVLARPGRKDRGIQLADLAVRNYQHAEDRPERSLKSLSNLFGLGDYDPEFKAVRIWDTAMDRGAWQYCCNDAGRTLKVWDYLAERIVEDFGEDGHRKNSTATRSSYSERLWSLVSMSENGCALSTKKLRKMRRETEYAMLVNQSFAKGPLSGKGSQTWEMALMERCLEVATPEDLKLSGVKRQLRANKQNVAAFLDVLPDSCEERTQLTLLSAFRKNQKLVGSYLRPMLEKHKHKGVVYARLVIDRLAYPTWYPVPMTEHDDRGDEGGTNQGRLSCKKPALQTLPPRVKDCLRSRWKDGIMLWVDLSQIELRIAALLSGDPEMCAAYMEGRDLHNELTMGIFGDDIVNHADFKDHHRQVGKQSNFLLIYRGTANRLRQQLREKANVTLPMWDCTNIIEKGWQQRQGLRDHQDAVIETVKIEGRHIRPVYGDSRWFCGGSDCVQDTYEQTICNFPVQYEAVMVMLDVQSIMDRWLARTRLRTVICLQWHDAIIFDCRPEEIDRVESKLRAVLVDPPYYRKLCKHLGRTLPLGYDIKRKENP